MRLPLAAILLPAILMTACAANNGGSIAAAPFDPEHDQIGPDAPWPFWPATMRVHPLTRIVEDDAGERLLEARIEFTDRDGYTTRAFGFLRIELHDGDPAPLPAAAAGENIIGWNVDLRNLDRNQNHFDDVSRMYLMRLEFGEAPLPADPVLTVEFYSLNGTDFRAVHRIRR